MSDETIFIVLIASVAFAPSLCIWCLRKCIWGLRTENQVITELVDKADIDRDLAHTIYRIYGKSALELLDEPEKLENIICRLTTLVAYYKICRYHDEPTEINKFKTQFEYL